VNVLLSRAEQSVRAKRHIGLFLGCPEEYVEAHLAETLLDAFGRLPVFAGLRREKDRIVARSISLLLSEVALNDPLRPRIRESLSRLVQTSVMSQTRAQRF